MMPTFYLLCGGSRSKSCFTSQVHKKYMISSQIKSTSGECVGNSMAVNTRCSLILCPLLLAPGIITGLTHTVCWRLVFLNSSCQSLPRHTTRSPGVGAGPLQTQTIPLFSRLSKRPSPLYPPDPGLSQGSITV